MLRPENSQIIYLTEREGWTGCEAPRRGVVHCDAAQSFKSARERWWFIAVSRCGSAQVRQTALLALVVHRFVHAAVPQRNATHRIQREHPQLVQRV